MTTLCSEVATSSMETEEGIMNLIVNMGLRLGTLPSGFAAIAEHNQTVELRVFGEMLLNKGIRCSFSRHRIQIPCPVQLVTPVSSSAMTEAIGQINPILGQCSEFSLDFLGANNNFLLKFHPHSVVTEEPIKLPTFSQIIGLAGKLGLAFTCNSKEVEISKKWTNWEQVDRFAQLRLQLTQWKIEYTVHTSATKSWVNIPRDQANLINE